MIFLPTNASPLRQAGTQKPMASGGPDTISSHPMTGSRDCWRGNPPFAYWARAEWRPSTMAAPIRRVLLGAAAGFITTQDSGQINTVGLGLNARTWHLQCAFLYAMCNYVKNDIRRIIAHVYARRLMAIKIMQTIARTTAGASYNQGWSLIPPSPVYSLQVLVKPTHTFHQSSSALCSFSSAPLSRGTISLPCPLPRPARATQSSTVCLPSIGSSSSLHKMSPRPLLKDNTASRQPH